MLIPGGDKEVSASVSVWVFLQAALKKVFFWITIKMTWCFFPVPKSAHTGEISSGNDHLLQTALFPPETEENNNYVWKSLGMKAFWRIETVNIFVSALMFGARRGPTDWYREEIARTHRLVKRRKVHFEWTCTSKYRCFTACAHCRVF